jgi:hypothetical protein
MDRKKIDRIQHECTRFLTGHYRQTPRQVLLDLAESTSPDLAADYYGQGDLIASLFGSLLDRAR